MPERDRTAVDVETGLVHRQFAKARQHLRRERFVQLDEVDVVHRKARQLQDLPDCRHGPCAESLRRDPGCRVRDEARERLQTALSRKLLRM